MLDFLGVDGTCDCAGVAGVGAGAAGGGGAGFPRRFRRP
jgi:hypothetical protein